MRSINLKFDEIKTIISKPLPHILITNTNLKKWKACIYVSTSNLTGQALLLMKDISSEYSGKLIKCPIYVYTSSSKQKLETKISSKINSLLKNQ